MPENSIHSKLRETFPLVEKEDWKRFASQELEGKNPDEILSWNSEDQLRFFAYYDASDAKRNSLSQNYRLTVATDPYFGPARWLNVPAVTVTSEKPANELALQHLNHGADGILFKITGKLNLDNLLAGIDWRYCSLFFQTESPEAFTQAVLAFIEKNKILADDVSGGLFWDAIPNSKKQFTHISSLKNILSIPPSSPVAEIARALSNGVSYFDRSESQSVDFFKSIAFSVPVTTSFLDTIAKLKALRFLWYQVAHAYGYSSYSVSDLIIHARSEKWIDEKFQPHGNMLKGTTACMASIIGGADAITLDAEDETNSMMTRIARNVSSLLREESHFDKSSDPSAGAYAIDAMMNEFAQQAWKIFQDNQKK